MMMMIKKRCIADEKTNTDAAAKEESDVDEDLSDDVSLAHLVDTVPESVRDPADNRSPHLARSHLSQLDGSSLAEWDKLESDNRRKFKNPIDHRPFSLSNIQESDPIVFVMNLRFQSLS